MDQEREFVIGQEMADAQAADARRLAGGPPPSPLPTEGYDHARGEFGLFSIQPVPLDATLTDLVRRYRAAAPDERQELRDGIGTDGAYTLLAYARRAAVFAMRSGDAATIADGLGACAAVPYQRIDQRDGLVAMALLHHAGRRCGSGAESLFRGARELGEPAFANQLDALLERSQGQRDLQAAWGFVEADGPHGIGLLAWGYGPWSPSGDLARVALGVAEALDGDEYVIDDPMLGTDLPSVWLGASGDPGLEPALERIRAGATIHGRLRVDVSQQPGSQQLTAWVVETASGPDARLLAHLAHTPRSGDALLGRARGTLFALVVARSAVVGVPARETSERIARFASRLESALED